jgi:predicted component of type VI protein secretion system
MPSGASFRLIVRRGPQPNQQYDLTRDTITIGRDITNDIVINDPEVSRHHLRLLFSANGYTIEDLRSTNGTFINRQRITSPYQLSNGDLIGLGETVTLAYEVVSGGREQGATMVGAGTGGPPQPMAAQPRPASAPSYAPPPMSAADQEGEEDFFGADRNRWIVIGCGVLTLVFCCSLVLAGVVVDYMNLWCEIPVIGPLVGCS